MRFGSESIREIATEESSEPRNDGETHRQGRLCHGLRKRLDQCVIAKTEAEKERAPPDASCVHDALQHDNLPTANSSMTGSQYYGFCSLAALMTCFRRTRVVTVPTPPGTGVIAPATSLAGSVSTSPKSLSPSTLMPTSMTTAPGLM